jgi:hypothetical protein
MATKPDQSHRPTSGTYQTSGKYTPVVRSFSLPNGDKIVSLRDTTFRSAVRAANNALREERSGTIGRVERTKYR